MTVFGPHLTRSLRLLRAILTLLMGVAVVHGWLAEDALFTQPFPEFIPITFVTGWLLVLLGLTALAAEWGGPWLARPLALLTFLACVAAACVPGLERQLLAALEGQVTARGSYQPTVPLTSPLTACLIAVMAAQCALGRGRSCGRTLLGLGGLLLVLYAALVPIVFTDPGHPLLRLSQLPQGPTLLGVLYGVEGLRFRGVRVGTLSSSLHLVPSLVLVVASCCSLFMWRVMVADESARLQRVLQTEADALVQDLRSRLPQSLARFELRLRSWNAGMPLAEREASMGAVVGTERGVTAMAWVDGGGHVQWFGQTGAATWQSYLDGFYQQQLDDFLRRARSRNQWSMQVEDLELMFNQHMMLAYFPAPAGDGGLLVVFTVELLVSSMLSEEQKMRSELEIRAGSMLLLHPSKSLGESASFVPQVFRLQPHPEHTWTVKVWPNESMLSEQRFSIAPLTLVAGLMLSCFLALTSYLFLRSLEQARRVANSDARARALIGNLQQAVFLKDADLRYVAVNRVFCQQHRLDEAEILGRSDAELFPPDRSEPDRAAEREILARGGRIESEVTQPIDGKPRLLRVMRSPVRDAAGRVTGILGVTWDVTEQRQLETQLRQSQKMDAIGKLAGGIAHDFNNLLTVMIGNLFILRETLGDRGDPAALIQEAEHAANRAAELVRQLLSFSRQSPIRFEPVSLPSLVQEVARLVRRTMDAKVRIEVDAPEETWDIRGDSGQIHQVLMNLCINARDAMPQGGTLQLSLRNALLLPAQVVERLDARPGPFVRLRVRDSGVGMTPEVRARIFEPFFTTKEVGQGTGLGLAQVFGILQQHQGWIECHSQAGEGTCFELYFPRSQQAAPVEVVEAPPVRAGSETVLVIDDEQMIRSLVRRIFESAGYRVLAAEGGEEGLKLFRECPEIDLVMLDLNMPGMSGQETFRELLRADPKVRVIISSGYSEEQLEPKELEQVAAFLAKPFRRDQLLQVVREVIDATPQPRRQPALA